MHFIIIIIFCSGPDNLKEWVMIELQGDLKCDENEALSGKFVGDLHYFKNVILIILCQSL